MQLIAPLLHHHMHKTKEPLHICFELAKVGVIDPMKATWRRHILADIGDINVAIFVGFLACSSLLDVTEGQRRYSHFRVLVLIHFARTLGDRAVLRRNDSKEQVLAVLGDHRHLRIAMIGRFSVAGGKRCLSLQRTPHVVGIVFSC